MVQAHQKQIVAWEEDRQRVRVLKILFVLSDFHFKKKQSKIKKTPLKQESKIFKVNVCNVEL